MLPQPRSHSIFIHHFVYEAPKFKRVCLLTLREVSNPDPFASPGSLHTCSALCPLPFRFRELLGQHGTQSGARLCTPDLARPRPRGGFYLCPGCLQLGGIQCSPGRQGPTQWQPACRAPSRRTARLFSACAWAPCTHAQCRHQGQGLCVHGAS